MKLLIFLILLFIPLFIFRYLQTQTRLVPGDKVKITTRINQEPSIKSDQQIIRVNQNISIYLPRFPEYHYGDRLEIVGTVEKSEKGYYLKNPEAQLIEKHGFLAEIKRKMVSLFAKTLPEPESSLAAGVTFGVKEGFTPEFYNSLKNAGVLHVVVASGTNVTLVARVLIVTFVLFTTRRVAIIGALMGIWLYAFLVGLEAPITRAAIMGSLVFSAQELGKVYFAWWGLVISALVMLLIAPNWITDIGFLLSFGATAGILAFEKPIILRLRSGLSFFSEKKTTTERDSHAPTGPVPKFFVNDLSTSFAAQIVVTPILLFYFGQFAPWSPLVNGALLWTIAPMMALGFIGALLGLIVEPLGQFFIFLTYPLAFLFVKVVELF
ncbi:ComEC/Rec2 family competence protein [Candidatus Microgenomates bacterium]|nr:ComEC/Rec2 family competence protein [Candidatus Microgenomates bacterium]